MLLITIRTMKSSARFTNQNKSESVLLNFLKLLPLIIILIFLVLFLAGCSKKYDNLDLSMYKYRDTKNLVKFVYDAA